MEIECVNNGPHPIPDGSLRLVQVVARRHPLWKRLWAGLTGTPLTFNVRYEFVDEPDGKCEAGQGGQGR